MNYKIGDLICRTVIVLSFVYMALFGLEMLLSGLVTSVFNINLLLLVIFIFIGILFVNRFDCSADYFKFGLFSKLLLVIVLLLLLLSMCKIHLNIVFMYLLFLFVAINLLWKNWTKK